MSEFPKAYLYRRVIQAKLFIDSNYAAVLDLNNISDEAHFSKFHFIRLFKEIYGKTPHQYLISVRIEKAALLLRQGNAVSHACAEVGFESPTTFSGLFKRTVGISPSMYLAQHLKRNVQLQEKPLAFIPGCFAREKA